MSESVAVGVCYYSLFRAFGLLRQAVDTVIALDTAMIDLRKTTTATEEEYRQFYLDCE